MCGIAGLVDFNCNSTYESLAQMVNSMTHRGPDDHGFEVFRSDKFIVGMGQRRLSVIDLSAGGHQPMHFRHLSIVYNGEVYNFKEIKAPQTRLIRRTIIHKPWK